MPREAPAEAAGGGGGGAAALPLPMRPARGGEEVRVGAVRVGRDMSAVGDAGAGAGAGAPPRRFSDASSRCKAWF